MNSKSCPCIECLLIPVCRNKVFRQLFKNCQTLYDYVYNSPDTTITRLEEVSIVVQPKTWEMQGKDISFYGANYRINGIDPDGLMASTYHHKGKGHKNK